MRAQIVFIQAPQARFILKFATLGRRILFRK
jgi:hypothetical protein